MLLSVVCANKPLTTLQYVQCQGYFVKLELSAIDGTIIIKSRKLCNIVSLITLASVLIFVVVLN